LTNPELKNDKKVKEITMGDDCIYIDLFGGLRLSGPLIASDTKTDAKGADRKPRRMIVSGHEGIYDEALALG